MASSKEVIEYSNIADILSTTFGDVCSREAIYSIVESCSGDLNHAAHIIMAITSEENAAPNIIESSPHQSTNTENTGQSTTKKTYQGNTNNGAYTSAFSLTNTSVDVPINVPRSWQKLSYVEASKSKKKKTNTKQMDNSYQNMPKSDVKNNCNIWTEQIKRIANYHTEGARNLIIMRGAPGSGKSHLAKEILQITVGNNLENTHIFSTDDYFRVNNSYDFNKANLGIAHNWNQCRAFKALNMGISPVIIDNTNIELHEIAPYAKAGINNGYILEIVEPNTPWARNVQQLLRKNVHNVPLSRIERMLVKLRQSHVSSQFFVSTVGYPLHMQPPILRCLPKILSCDIANDTRKLTITKKINDNSSEANNDSISFNKQTKNKNNMEISDNKTSNMMYSVEGEDQFIRDVSVAENSEFCSNEIIDNIQTEILSKTKENTVLTDVTDFNNIREDKNIFFLSEKLQKSDSKIFLEQNEQISSNTKDTDLYEKDELQQDLNLTKCLKDEVTLKETSKFQDSKFIENTREYLNTALSYEDFEKVEIEWDNGEAWEENTDTIKQNPSVPLDSNFVAKLPRTKKTKDNKDLPLDSNNDWKTYMEVLPGTDNNNISNPREIIKIVETKSTETCVEFGDTNMSNIKDGFKILPTIARDINPNYLPSSCAKITNDNKFDKSSLTCEEDIILSFKRCKNEEKHFKAFRKIFRDLKKQDLRYIFDKCFGNVHWAVGIVLENNKNENKNEYKSPNEKSDTEEEEEEVLDYDNSCSCIFHYDIIPDITPATEKTEHEIPSTSTGTNYSNLIKPKQKKSVTISDASLSLKRQIEQNIVIPDEYYSEACLKVRKMRRGECVVAGDISTSQNNGTGITMDNTNQSVSLSNVIDDQNKINENNISGSSNIDVGSEDSGNEPTFNEVQKTVNINIGYDFLNQLDMFFGRTGIVYPDEIEPKISMPISLLLEINALWVQSLMYQLEEQSKSREEMIKQDEKFARELAMKETEISRSGKEAEVPNLSEIMDMEKALALYRKDCEASMEKDRPTDLAARLSAKKLYDLFPELPPKDLDEILMAHDFNFQNTVTVLLKTQGRNDIIEAENGVNKFIMAQELKRQELFLATEKKRLTEESWPALPNSIDMNIVKGYSDKAKQYLEGKEYYAAIKGKLDDNYVDKLASNYETLSELYMLRCEQANYIVAASVMQIQASKDQCTLDLHFMNMKEALEAVDIFLDSHILRLRQSRDRKYDLVFLITGRGLHSIRGPVIKPAVSKRLTVRGLHFRESNPGLIAVNVSAGDILACQIVP